MNCLFKTTMRGNARLLLNISKRSSASVRPPSSLPRFSTSTGYNDDEENQGRKTALVLGSSGALGSTVANFLSRDLGMRVLGADVLEVAGDSDTQHDWELDDFVQMAREGGLADMTIRLVRGTHLFLLGKPELDVIVCASGGWEGDPATSFPSVQEGDDDSDSATTNLELEIERDAREYAQTIVRMRRMNLDPVLSAGFVAHHYMADGGLMVVLGASAALAPTPGMMGYGLAKSASHHFIHTLGASTGKSLESKSMRKQGRMVRRNLQSLDNLTVVGILPSMIDTPANRKAAPSGDFDAWTKPLDIAKEIGTWIETPALRPHSGSLVKVRPRNDGHPGAVFELAR